MYQINTLGLSKDIERSEEPLQKNSQAVDVLGIGTGNLDLGSRKDIALLEVLYAPNILSNLFIIRCSALRKVEVRFKGTQVHVLNEHVKLVGVINKNSYASL